MRARERSMRYLRGLGMRVAIAEHWNPHARVRQDLFGFADLVALSMSTDREDGQIVAIQCVNTHLEDHILKIANLEAAKDWCSANGGIEIHNWVKRCANGRGSRKTWQLEQIELNPWHPEVAIAYVAKLRGKKI